MASKSFCDICKKETKDPIQVGGMACIARNVGKTRKTGRKFIKLKSRNSSFCTPSKDSPLKVSGKDTVLYARSCT